jgi:DNA-binding response OmpR family regulator
MEKKRILVVDDEEDIRTPVKFRLTALGYEVSVAVDGQEGLDKAKKEHPDLIILDLMLPKIDGYRVCGLLKADTRFSKIPIILFTARVQEDDKAMSKEAGADAYITKPFNPEVLVAKIKELLKEV